MPYIQGKGGVVSRGGAFVGAEVNMPKDDSEASLQMSLGSQFHNDRSSQAKLWHSDNKLASHLRKSQPDLM